MKRLTILLIIIQVHLVLKGQEASIVYLDTSFTNLTKTDVFVKVSNDFPEDSLKLIAKFGSFVNHSEESNLLNLFCSFKEKSNDIGANSFRIEEISKETSPWYIVISVYFLDDKELISNNELYPKNQVFVLGDILPFFQPKKFRFNRKKTILSPMRFLEYQNQIGKDAIVSRGGPLGVKTWVRGHKDRLPHFLSVGSIALTPNKNISLPYRYTRGLITPVDLGLGQFLISTLTKME